jgi:ubiquinone biosynthesis protein
MSETLHLQDLPRVNQIAAVLAKNGLGHLLHLIGLRAPLEAGSEDSTPFARRLRQSLVDLGPTFVKLGQVLSVRPDILPDAVLKEFQTLQDRVPPMPFEDVRDVVESELQLTIAEVFDEFDDICLGSASIAQVHRARLKDGREVAVKLQRKGIERMIRSDLSILYSLARLIENNNIVLPGLYTPTAIIREFDAAIREELDFGYELKNCEKMAANFRDVEDVVIPKVVRQWSTRRVFMLDLVEGRPLKHVMEEASVEEGHRIAHQIMEATYQQVFEHGFFHGDPHPGNLFVSPDGKLVFLDFGIAGTLSGAMQDTIVAAFTSMVFRDAEALAMSVYRAGATKQRIDLRQFIDECQRMMVKYHGASLDDIANRATFVEVVQLCMRFHISLPAEFAVLSRAIALIEGEVRALMPGIDIVAEVNPYARRLMAKRFAPERLAHDLGRMMVMTQAHLKDLPTQFNQVLLDLEGGSITIITKDPDAPRLREEIRSAVLRLALAALASTVSLVSALFIVMSVWYPGWLGAIFFGLVGVGLLGTGSSLFGALGIHVLFAGLFNLTLWRQRFMSVLRFFSWRRDRR